MTLGSLDRRCFRAFVPLLMFAGAAGAQVTTLFSENFEGPPGPPGNVGAYTEVDPFSGVPAPTLWHEGNACGSFPVSNYAVTTSTAPFSSILGGPSTVTLFTSGDDGFSGRIVVPFVYQHFGIAFQLVDVSRNGMLSTFPGAGGGTDFINQAPGTATTPNGVIGAWWDDTFHSTGQTAYAVLGSAPNRQFVVEWNGLEAFPGNGSGENETSQVLIDEGTGVLHFRYDNATFATGGDPWSATCGTESFDGAAGTDATGLGANNSVFPSTGFDLTPLPPAIPPLPACFGTGAATYNQGDIGIFNYDTGVANAGAIESPAAVSTSATATLVMIFDFTKDTEGGGSTSFDQCFVETSPTGLATWTTQVQLSGNTGPCGGPIDTQILVLPASLSGTSFQHRFRFDTVDSVGNNYNGWSVDNIRINQAAGTIAVAYSENFEAGTVPGVTVGNMTEEDPFGTALDTLWHAEANCDGGSPGTYTASVGPAGYTSISGNPSAVLIHGPFTDDSLGIIGVPIAFNFYGAPAATLGVDSNGPVGPGLPFSDFTNDPIPTTFTPNGWVSPWWDDNHTGSTGS
ncbi:MAG TPA: hypothetical protein VFI25_19270, partial [Planctomycetota bacterium]|nr:hypothetical protein [Planctomycetota bacterium]